MRTSIPSRPPTGRGPAPRRLRGCLLAVGVLLTVLRGAAPAAPADVPAAASGPATRPATRPAGAPDAGEELLLFRDLPVVVSAARQAQPIHWLSLPVSILSADDIHYSGLQRLPEILQFVPGVDALQLDRNNYAVGVRGLHDVFADRTLVLIDGRSVNNTAFGGAEWCRLPLLVEDIKRIEVVRGPGGAAWGANAMTGVINIITKPPEETQGWFGSTTVDLFGDTFSHVRYGGRTGRWSYRHSVGYQDWESSDDALEGDHFFSRDFGRDWVYDGLGVYRTSERTWCSLGLAYSHLETGDYGMFGYFPMKDHRLNSARAFGRVDHDLAGGGKAHVQWFGNYSRTHAANLIHRYCTMENNLDGQLAVPVGAHQLCAGGNVRLLSGSTRSTLPEQAVVPGEPYDEQWVGLFAMDRWEITRRLTVEGQVRGDWYSETAVDWSARTSALYALDRDRRHVARLSAAKAFRAPSFGLRKTSLRRMPVGPGTYFVNVVEPLEHLRNEETWSLEAGYAGRLTDALTLRTDSYYQRFEHLLGMRNFADPFGLGRTFVALDNIDGADAYGVETELAMEDTRGKLSAWYAYNGFHRDQGHQDVRALLPARNKVGLSGRLNLPYGLTANANYRYTTTTRHDRTAFSDTHASHRLDLLVAKAIAGGTGEVAVGVADVLNTSDEPVTGTGGMVIHRTPGRTFFVRLQVKF